MKNYRSSPPNYLSSDTLGLPCVRKSIEQIKELKKENEELSIVIDLAATFVDMVQSVPISYCTNLESYQDLKNALLELGYEIK